MKYELFSIFVKVDDDIDYSRITPGADFFASPRGRYCYYNTSII